MTYLSVKGNEIKVNDYRVLGHGPSGLVAVNSISLGQLSAGARYADVTLENGQTERCWEGFLYRVGRNS